MINIDTVVYHLSKILNVRNFKILNISVLYI